MDKFVITIARETGAGGNDTAKLLSERLGIPYYNRELLKLASEVSGIHESLFGIADERIGVRQMLSAAGKVYNGEILTPDSDDFTSTQNLFNFQAAIIKELASQDESSIIIGRTGGYLLRDRPDVLRVFIHADEDSRIERIQAIRNLDIREAARYIRLEDKRRAAYYRYYTGEEWRDASAYDLSLDSSVLGIEGCADLICDAVPDFLKWKKLAFFKV